MMRPRLGGGEITLVRPTDLSGGPPKHLQIASISPDAQFLAIGVKSSGADTQAVRFFDVQRRELLKDSLLDGFGSSLVFTANPPGFYYAHEPLNSAEPYRAVFWHGLGSEREDQEIFFGGRETNVHVGATGTADGQVLLYLRSSDCPGKMELFIHQIGRHKAPVKLLDINDFVLMPFFIGQELYGLTDWSAPRFRVVRIDVNHPQPESWAEVVPEGTATIIASSTVTSRSFSLLTFSW
jgi:prolyl oligopeptidase